MKGDGDGTNETLVMKMLSTQESTTQTGVIIRYTEANRESQLLPANPLRTTFCQVRKGKVLSQSSDETPHSTSARLGIKHHEENQTV